MSQLRKHKYIPPHTTDPENVESLEHIFEGEIETEIGPVKRISTHIFTQDKLGTVAVRCGIKRDSYKVAPGIYAVGNPNDASPMLVTCNYKLTFDAVRHSLSGLDAWLLVINTGGVNVWCAAGKGSFGGDEIIYRVRKTGAAKIVKSKLMILPQLGAPGVNSKKIEKYTGFKVVFGPVRASDIKEFLAKGLKADKHMRTATFKFQERLVLTPVEFVQNAKFIGYFLLMLIVLNYIGNDAESLPGYLELSLLNTIPYALAVAAATFGFPLLLPVLPFRSFSAKGIVLGVIFSAIIAAKISAFAYADNVPTLLGNSLMMTSTIAFISLNFTGSSNVTSLSGVQKETMLYAPIFAVCALLGICLLFFGRLI